MSSLRRRHSWPLDNILLLGAVTIYVSVIVGYFFVLMNMR